MVREPERILDEAHEQVLERVCAIDVAKDAGKVCLRTPTASGTTRRMSMVWDVPARTKAVSELADHLVCQGVQKVTVESTSDHWRIWFYLLEARGLDVQLVNARDVKNVPGRPKTDKLDSVWLAKLTEKGLLRPSFVSPKPIRELRRLHPAPRRSDRGTDPALAAAGEAARRRPDQGLGGGQSDRHRLGAGHGRGPDRRAAQPEGSCRPGPWADETQVRRSGRSADRPDRQAHHRHRHRVGRDRGRGVPADAPGRRPARPHRTGTGNRVFPGAAGGVHPASQRLGSSPTDPPPTRLSGLDLVEILDEIPGVGAHIAQVVIAEIGLEMSRFPTAGHLVSRAKHCPRTIQSGTRPSAGTTGKGNKYLRAVLGDAAAGAAKTNTFLGERYRRIIKRRGKLKALVAVARAPSW